MMLTECILCDDSSDNGGIVSLHEDEDEDEVDYVSIFVGGPSPSLHNRKRNWSDLSDSNSSYSTTSSDQAVPIPSSTISVSSTSTLTTLTSTGSGSDFEKQPNKHVKPNYSLHAKKIRGTPPKKWCSYSECRFLAATGVPTAHFCPSHGGSCGYKVRGQAYHRRCRASGCINACCRSPYNYCKRHGGGVRCRFPSCPTSARNGAFFCTAHGGGRRCQMPGCAYGAVYGGGKKGYYCNGHGGGHKCMAEGCNAGRGGRRRRDAASGANLFCGKHKLSHAQPTAIAPQHTARNAPYPKVEIQKEVPKSLTESVPESDLFLAVVPFVTTIPTIINIPVPGHVPAHSAGLTSLARDTNFAVQCLLALEHCDK
jgi:hypothetical protein